MLLRSDQQRLEAATSQIQQIVVRIPVSTGALEIDPIVPLYAAWSDAFGLTEDGKFMSARDRLAIVGEAEQAVQSRFRLDASRVRGLSHAALVTYFEVNTRLELDARGLA